MSECLVTSSTLVRFLATVQPTMFGQVMFVFERTLAHIARERPQAYQHSKHFLINMYQHSVNTTLTLKKSEHLYSALHGTNHSKALRHGSHSF